MLRHSCASENRNSAFSNIVRTYFRRGAPRSLIMGRKHSLDSHVRQKMLESLAKDLEDIHSDSDDDTMDQGSDLLGSSEYELLGEDAKTKR